MTASSPAPAPSARVETTIGVATVVAALAALVWLLAEPGEPVGSEPDFAAMPVAAALGYGATATLLCWHDRARVVRRVLLAIAATQAVTALAGLYADAGLAAADLWPWTAEVHWLASWLWSPAYVAVGAVLPLVLPDGRPLWRPAAVLSAVAVVVTALLWATTPYDRQDFPTTTGLTNPVGVEAVMHPVLLVGGALLPLGAVGVALTSAVVRWRRSGGAERDQLTWLLLGVVASVALGLTGIATGGGGTLSALAMLPVPLTIGIALVRHRLWDVEVVVSRSLLYGLLTGGAVAAYVVAVAVLGSVLGESAGAPVLATAVVALLVLPLHTRLQRLVNRLVHGGADDPYTALARLGDRLEAAAEPTRVAEHVLPELVGQVAHALRMPYAAVLLADGTRTEHGEATERTSRTPLLFAGSPVGELVVGGDELSRTDRRRLEALARQAAVAVHTVLLARDAGQARAQTATAREEERRRLRRDLHDGMGPVLAALALQAETARDLVDADPVAATRLLDRLVPRLNEAVADVRTLVHDLRPPTLDELGLAGSLHELAARFVTPGRTVRVEATSLPPLPAAVDLAAYRIAAEALANAARHAEAGMVVLHLGGTVDRLELRVVDDGRGLPPGAVAGVGLRSMRERAEELGGSCVVSPGPAGHGTVVTATIPLRPHPPATTPVAAAPVQLPRQQVLA